jgi:hypothetical protein
VQTELAANEEEIKELFPNKLPTLKDINKGPGTLKNLLPSATSDSKSKEGKRSGGKRRSKGVGTSSDTTGDNKTTSKSKSKSKGSSNE